MEEVRLEVKMPELLVFAKVFIVGIISAEVFRIAYYLGDNFASILSGVDWRIEAAIIFVCLLVCIVYAVKRKAHLAGIRLAKSYRVDLFLTLIIGIGANCLFSSSLDVIHKIVKQTSPWFAPAILAMLLLMLVSSICRAYWMNWQNKQQVRPQLLFLEDEEIKSQEQDILSNGEQAKSFAKTVLESGSAHSGLVFGIDGPWGVGKTSFINLAENYWKKNAEDEVIVFRFEPLRYASDSDLSQRFIKELSAVIQKLVYAPEFQPVASRYSRMLKSKADMSFLGFKFSLEPGNETIDEMLGDIDDVLKRIRRRLIIVIDDLDRLEPKAVNNVLFTARRTFKLSQATYILCYDTENLVAGKDDGEKAREFLEKFVTLKLSLFVDSSNIIKYLERDWSSEQQIILTTPSDSMFKLTSILKALAELLKGEKTAQYMPIIGDLRKVKRFVNATLLMQIEKTDLSKTDFNRQDLINLLLLHLNYPGVFRRIYAEETERNLGMFSLSRSPDGSHFINSKDFTDFMEEQDSNAIFLLKQLFDVEELELDANQSVDEAVKTSRACFNDEWNRNLENYLKLIVRFVTPEPRETFVLYQKAVERIRKSNTIKIELEKSDFDFEHGEKSHDKFWSLLVSQSHRFNSLVVEDAINTLIDYLPKYSLIDTPGIHQGLRSRFIYSLIRLLDKGEFGGVSGGGHSLPNRRGNVVEVAHRIFGEDAYVGRGIISMLVSEERGVLGWKDLMTFRLACSADRQGQWHNVYSALILHQDKTARTDGAVSALAVNGMRQLSQEVFALFRERYIEPKCNFLTEIDKTSDDNFLGEAASYFRQQKETSEATERFSLDDKLASARSKVKVFILYQLCNSKKSSGTGLYDEYGQSDSGGIAGLMNEYIFKFCFNPKVCESNILHFANHCLSNFGHDHNDYEFGFSPNNTDLLGGLNSSEMVKYWQEHREFILGKNLPNTDKRVLTSNYIATYSENLQSVFDVLDKMSEEFEN